MASESVTIPAEAIPSLRRMLAIGLAALAEVERVRDSVDRIESAGHKVGKALRPIHPTGANEAGDFATALLWLDQATPAEEQQA